MKIAAGRSSAGAISTIELNADADFICLIGENGVGKSNLLELIAFASPHLGLGPGSVRKRPLPFQAQRAFGIAGSPI